MVFSEDSAVAARHTPAQGSILDTTLCRLRFWHVTVAARTSPGLSTCRKGNMEPSLTEGVIVTMLNATRSAQFA